MSNIVMPKEDLPKIVGKAYWKTTHQKTKKKFIIHKKKSILF